MKIGVVGAGELAGRWVATAKGGAGAPRSVEGASRGLYGRRHCPTMEQLAASSAMASRWRGNTPPFGIVPRTMFIRASGLRHRSFPREL